VFTARYAMSCHKTHVSPLNGLELDQTRRVTSVNSGRSAVAFLKHNLPVAEISLFCQRLLCFILICDHVFRHILSIITEKSWFESLQEHRIFSARSVYVS
jgi:hypothetical protein